MEGNNNNKRLLYPIFLLFLILSSCSDFEGFRTARYDGQKVIKEEEAILDYQNHSEITGEAKEYYLRYQFSQDILNSSLDYPSEKAYLLEEGTYQVGRDIPSGRVSLLGNESVFTSENYAVHVGNMIIRDEDGLIYFENLFHSSYGQQVVQIDFIEGHVIEIIGKDSQITAFYSEDFPSDPYILMDLPELIQTRGIESVNNPIQKDKKEQKIELAAGIYEVGVHLKEGSYQIESLEAPHHTEMYIFRKNINPIVIELVIEDSEENELENIPPVITLKDGDKIYLHLVKRLIFRKIN